MPSGCSDTDNRIKALDAPTIGKTVTDEVHAPHLTDALGKLQRQALRGGTP